VQVCEVLAVAESSQGSGGYPGGEDAMIWGEYCFAPRFPRPTEPPPIGKLIERFERLRAEE